MVTFVPDFVNPECAAWKLEPRAAAGPQGSTRAQTEAVAAFRDDVAAEHPEPVATLADVVAHCEHVREVAGIDHVGLGGDYDGTDPLPEGLEDVTGYPRLLAALAERGWSERRPVPAHQRQRAARDARRRVGRDPAPLGARAEPGQDREIVAVSW